MNILFDINHPAHVHLFRNAITTLKSDGHKIVVTARDKDVTLRLLNSYQIPYIMLSKAQNGILGLGLELLIRQWKLFFILRKQEISICVSATGACSVHVCKLLGIPTLVFYDTEHATLQNALSIPLATRYITPDCYQNEPVKNQITYPSVHELAYCHPNHFQPDDNIYDLLQIDRETKFVILRFVSWNASHDTGQKGLSLTLRKQLIEELSKYARVFIVSEADLTPEFYPYQINIPPERILDALYYASLFIGEGATMASECACFGTPAIYVNSLKLGYITEEDQKYGLVYDLEHDEEIINKAIEIISDQDKEKWHKKRDRFISEKIDLTQRMVEIIEQFAQPESKN